MKYVLRLIENLDSIREGVELWLMFIVGGFILGIAWAVREIADTWTLRD